jgi:hypothetical protein
LQRQHAGQTFDCADGADQVAQRPLEAVITTWSPTAVRIAAASATSPTEVAVGAR